jgi:hypothetical protein
MNRQIALLSTMAALAFAGSVAQAGLTGSKHDFSAKTWNTTGQQICQPCHTPHGGMATVTSAPLWNHTETTHAFTLYSSTVSSTYQGGTATITGVSKLCLSCHDGTVALDSFGGATGTTMLTGSTLVGFDLSNDHPVGFTYNTAQ